MEPVEQVFLHVRSVTGIRTVDVAATTEFVRNSDLKEIAGWFSVPETKSLIRFDRLNVFFHPLPSGDYAIGMITPGQRGLFSFFQPPKSFFVRILIVSAQTLLEKANHPLALFDDFRRRHKIPIVFKIPKRLVPLLPSRSPELANRERFDAAARNPGATVFASLFQSLFDSECTFFHSKTHSTLSIFSVLFDLLPIPYRTELTFSTELFFSLHNPFRVIGLSGSRRRAVQQAKTLTIPLVLSDNTAEKKQGLAKTLAMDPWSRFVYEIMQTRNFPFIETQLKAEYQRIFETAEDKNAATTIRWENLHGIAVAKTQAIRGDTFSVQKIERQPPDNVLTVPDDREALRCFTAVEQLLPMLDKEIKTENRPAAEFSPQKTPIKTAATLLTRFPHLQKELIGELDSFVTRAVFGDESVLPKIRTIWQSLSFHVAWNEKDIIREEYLSLIRSFLVQSPVGNQPRPIHRNTQFLDLILIFLEK